jgi:ABC-type polysaccharide/polyol phosphate export permease
MKVGSLAFVALLVRCQLHRSFQRSIIGPFWNTAWLLAATILLGIFFGAIFKREINGYAAYLESLSIGLIVWSFLSSTTNECCAAFARWMQVLRYNAAPFRLLTIAVVVRQTLLFAVNLGIFLAIQAIFFSTVPNVLSGLVGLALTVLNVGWMALVGAIVGARYRDFGQLASGALHIMFFLTPVIWVEHFLGRYEYLLDFNPFHYLLAEVRMPLLGLSPAPGLWIGSCLLAVVGWVLALACERYSRNRVPYWV